MWLPQVGSTERYAVDEMASIFRDLGAPTERAGAYFGG